jgi:hypothetical protein
MEQITVPASAPAQASAPKEELKLEKKTIVKLDMGKVGALIRKDQDSDVSASTVRQCDSAVARDILKPLNK